MTSKDWFKINGVSSDTVDVFVDSIAIPLMARQRYSTYELGADENMAMPDDTYEDINYSIVFYDFFRENFDNTRIYAFLSNAKKLEISRLPEYYFKVRQTSVNNAQSSHDGKKIRYEVSFVLAPFKYKTDNEPIIVSSGDVVINTGTRYSKPLIEVSGSGTINFVVNNISFTLIMPENSTTVVVDSEWKVVYDNDTKKVLWNCTSGKFPLLSVGDNTIYFDEGTTVKLWKNERCY